ncbi:MAG TPA: plasmid stability protein [Rhodospirillaceae bacterium]|nr:plasmid stability protein [Rhodospirillaceae bacterium]
MPSIVIRQITDEIHRALKVRADAHGCSTEAEVRAILAAAVQPPDRTRIGSLLAQIGRDIGGVDLDIARDPSPPRAARFD